MAFYSLNSVSGFSRPHHLLILTRCVGEILVIELPNGESIEVTVTSLNGDQVRLGTNAPEDIHVRREELLLKQPG